MAPRPSNSGSLGGKKSGGSRQQNFAGAEDCSSSLTRFPLLRLKFGGAKFAGGKIDERETDGLACGMAGDGGQEIVLSGRQHAGIGGRAGSDDADDFAADELLALGRFLGLLADGDFVAGTDQAGDVIFRGVIGNAAHGYGVVFFFVAGGEGDLKLF